MGVHELVEPTGQMHTGAMANRELVGQEFTAVDVVDTGPQDRFHFLDLGIDQDGADHLLASSAGQRLGFL